MSVRRRCDSPRRSLGPTRSVPWAGTPGTRVFNYCVGDQASWRTGVASYEVVYQGLYEGVDLHVWGLRSRLKYEFHVAPGRIIARSRCGTRGSRACQSVTMALWRWTWAGRGVIRDDAPYVYQEIDGRKVELAGRFVACDERTYSFEVIGDIRPAPAGHRPEPRLEHLPGRAQNDYATDVAADARAMSM